MTKQKEWMIHVWGGAWNHDANPSIEKDYGMKDGYHYFDTEEEKNRFLEMNLKKKLSVLQQVTHILQLGILKIKYANLQ